MNIAIISYGNCSNLGDRLGQGLMLSLLPTNVEIDFLNLPPFWKNPNKQYDLIIVGTGHSIFHKTLEDDDFINFFNNSKQKIGFFGIQYHDLINEVILNDFISNLDYWYARNENDVFRYSTYNPNILHTGDILTNSIPLSNWTIDGTVEIEESIIDNNFDSYKIISEIQKYRHVSSPRLHPLLVALNSAENFKYKEQREIQNGNEKLVVKSNKFENMLFDIFKKKFEEENWYRVNREMVINYRILVEQNLKIVKKNLFNICNNY